MAVLTENELLSKAILNTLNKINTSIDEYPRYSAEEIEHLSHAVLTLFNAKSILENC